MVEFKTNEEYRQFTNDSLDKVNKLAARLNIGQSVPIKMGGKTLNLVKIDGDYEQCSTYCFSFNNLEDCYVNIGSEELPFDPIETNSSKLYDTWNKTDTNKGYVEWLEDIVLLNLQ